MPKAPSKLTARLLVQDELDNYNGPKKKVLVIDWLKAQLCDPETQQPISVGQGIEIGPFDTEVEGRNWIKYYLPDATRELGWGVGKTKGGHRMSPTITEPRPRDGKVFMWIIRVKE